MSASIFGLNNHGTATHLMPGQPYAKLAPSHVPPSRSNVHANNIQTLHAGYSGVDPSKHGKSGYQVYQHFFRGPKHQPRIGGGAQISPSIFLPFSSKFKQEVHGMPPLVQKSIKNF